MTYRELEFLDFVKTCKKNILLVYEEQVKKGRLEYKKQVKKTKKELLELEALK